MLNLETSVVNSALWAAAGDAIGWISELTDAKGLERRSGSIILSKPVKWQRKIGGMSGVFAELYAGTYSDDTQLRLAVSRSIRGDGIFDVEPFAKIELPVWLSYALGAGKGSKAAATNLIRRDINWFSNFFTYSENGSYINGGGNGAAMRIQPHVWRRARHKGRLYLDDVVKDSIVTHGHMRGVCGAVFHADCLAFVLAKGQMPGPEDWENFARGFVDIEDAIKRNVQLNRFWLAAWEAATGDTISNALNKVVIETLQYIDTLRQVHWGVEETYAEILEALELLSSERKGTGTNTALVAAALAWDKRNTSPITVVLEAANAVGSDTDTIATMAGALAGAAAELAPTWIIQDADYIITEARRMVKISLNQPCNSFPYPDLIGWQPPVSQSDAVGKYRETLALSGFGLLEPIGKQWKSGDFAWQWFKLVFGQTILCKHRVVIKAEIGDSLMPAFASQNARTIKKIAQENKHTNVDVETLPRLPLFPDEDNHGFSLTNVRQHPIRSLECVENDLRSIDDLTEMVIQSNFNPKAIGDCLIECAESPNGVDRTIAFSAIVAKALLVRKKRSTK